MKHDRILVTAGSKRLGKIISQKIIKNNYSIILHYNKSKIEAEETAHHLSKYGEVDVYQADFCNIDQTEKFVQILEKNYKNWVGLVNNAGLFNFDTSINFDINSLQKHMSVNFTVPSILIKTLYKNLKQNHLEKNKSAGVINIIDAKVFGLNPDYYSYTLSKLSLHGLTKMAALCYAPLLRVNGIAPGITLPLSGQSEKDFEEAHKNNLLKNSSSVKEIEDAILFLLNSHSVTGEILLMDGGAHLCPPRRDVSIKNI